MAVTAPPRPPIGPSASELGQAIRLYREAMPPGRLTQFDIGPLDRLGMTVEVAAFTNAEGYVNDGFGYGATPAEAMVGALGEISETAHVDAALRRAPVEIATVDEMRARHGREAVLDPLTLCLPAGSDTAPARRIAWIGVKRWGDGAPGMAPLECIATDPGQHRRRAEGLAPLFRPITCGLGAGVSLEQALAHGVLELLQRDGNCTTFRAMDQGVEIDLDGVSDPGIAGLIARFGRAGVSVRAKLASTEFGLTNLYVIGSDRSGGFPLIQTACGEAVHANAERALRKALLEFAAARCRKTFMHGPLAPIARLAPDGYLERYRAAFDLGSEEPRALDEMLAWVGMGAPALRALLAEHVFSERQRVRLGDLPSVSDGAVVSPRDRLADLGARLGGAGMALWYFDASPGTSGPRVIKAVVPGLEGETLSYRRLGVRGAERLLARGVAFVSQTKTPGALRAALTTEAEARLGGPVWLDPEALDAIVGRAYPLYREPSSHAVQFALEER